MNKGEVEIRKKIRYYEMVSNRSEEIIQNTTIKNMEPEEAVEATWPPNKSATLGLDELEKRATFWLAYRHHHGEIDLEERIRVLRWVIDEDEDVSKSVRVEPKIPRWQDHVVG